MFVCMRRRSRWQRLLKWCGLIPLLLVGGAMVSSFVGPARYRVTTSDGVFGIVLRSGWLSVGYHEWPRIPPWLRTSDSPDILRSIDEFDRRGLGGLHRRKPEQAGPAWLAAGPIGLPLIVLMLPLAVLWYRDRPFPHGHCQRCGCNLRSAPAVRCPKCGQEVPTPRG